MITLESDADAMQPASPAWRIAAAVATAAAAALFAWVIATAFWRWFGPSPVEPPTANAPEPWTPAIVAVPLFGTAVPSATRAPPGGAGAEAAPTDVRLLGVFAGRDGEGYALFRLASRGAVLARPGQEITTDVTLEAVRPDGVRLRDRGEIRDIALRFTAAMPAPAAGAPSRPGANVAACAVPAGYKGPVYRINAELLGGMAAQPESWRPLFVPGADGLAVRDQSGFAGMLGLKAGDRLTSASGIALATVDDILAGVVRPLQSSQPVRVLGRRDGKPLEWWFVNAATCAG